MSIDTCVCCGETIPEGRQICPDCEISQSKDLTNTLKRMSQKNDEGKPRLDLVPAGIIEAVGIIRTYGVEKYGEIDGWKQVEPNRYVAALMRHLCRYLDDPNSVDEESGYPHLWHMACNVAFLIEFQRMGAY